MASFDMSSVQNSLYHSTYDSYAHPASPHDVPGAHRASGQFAQEDIGVTFANLSRKQAGGAASYLPHTWQLSIAADLYNENSHRKSWLTRELGSVHFAKTYGDVVQNNKRAYLMDRLEELRKKKHHGLDLSSVYDQLEARFKAPGDYPLPGWSNGFVHGFEVADVSIIILLMYDLTPPDEWTWKSSLYSLVGALYNSHSPYGDWQQRTAENESNGTFSPGSVHAVDVDAIQDIRSSLGLHFGRTIKRHGPLYPPSPNELTDWAKRVFNYVHSPYNDFKGMESITRDQLRIAYETVASSMGGSAYHGGHPSAYAYELRFFINSFIPPNWWIMTAYDSLSMLPKSTPPMTDEDYIRQAAERARSETDRRLTPMPDAYDKAMADEPPLALPPTLLPTPVPTTAPTPVPTPVPVVPVGPGDASGEMPDGMVVVNAVEIGDDKEKLKRIRQEDGVLVHDLPSMQKMFKASGSAGVLAVLNGFGLYKGTVLRDGLTRVNHGRMDYSLAEDDVAHYVAQGFASGRLNEFTGAMYDGGWKDDLWHGSGTLYFPATQGITPDSVEQGSPCIYTGAFANGQFDGYGVLDMLRVGQRWEGWWKEGKRTDHTSRLTIPPKQSSYWATNQQVIGIWPDGAPEFVPISEYAHQRALQLKEKHTPNGPNTELVLVQLPSYGTKIDVPVGGGIVLRSCSPEAFVAISNFFGATNPRWLGKGADTRNYTDYNTITPLAMFDVDYMAHMLYHTHKTAVGSLNVENRISASKKMVESDPTLKHVLDTSTCTRIGEFLKTLNMNIFSRYEVPLVGGQNEQYLFHSGPWSSIWSILQTGFDRDRSSGGLFGRGVYFAEDPGKCDQYAVTRNPPYLPMARKQVTQVQEYFGIPDHLLADAVVNDGKQDIFAMLMCRVVVGSAIHRSLTDFEKNETGGVKNRFSGNPEPLFYEERDPTTNKASQKPYTGDMRKASNLSNMFNTIVGKHEIGPHTPNRFRFREFIVYNGVVARPTQLIFYKRTKQNIPTHYVWTDAYACPAP